MGAGLDDYYDLEYLVGNVSKLVNLKSLSLRNFGLETLPDSIAGLQRLELLDLEGNEFKKFPAVISKLKSLRSLSLCNFGLETLPDSIVGLQRLELLDLGGNRFKKFPAVISKLRALRYLCITPETLNEVPDSVSELQNLELLSINPQGKLFVENGRVFFPEKIPDYTDPNGEQLYKFSQIRRLDLSGAKTGIDKIDFSRFENLTELALNNCNLEEIPASIFRLTNLEILDLGKNRIKFMPEAICRLKNLQMLILAYNNIEEVPSCIVKLPLKDKIIDYPYDYNNGLLLRENPIKNVPLEIIDQGFGAIKNYFDSIENSTVTNFNSAKLMIVGRGRVGKTTLLENLIDPETDIDIKDEDTTRGIDIRKWNFQTAENLNFETRIWDFGGQQQYLTPHQFFLTDRSLYVLVWDALQEEDDITFNHWLNQIKFFGGNSPVIVVMNKREVRNKYIDESGLKEAFTNIVSFHKVSCTKKIGIADLREEIMQELLRLKHVKDLLPFTWKYIRDELEKKSQKGTNYISDEEYYSLCRYRNLDKKEGRYLSNYLHDLGTIIHFGRDPVLQNILILNPDWLTKAIYAIIDDDKVIENRGSFNFDDLVKIWIANGYQSANFGHLIRLMERFEFCLQIGDGDQYLMPVMLSPETPELKWSGTAKTTFLYEYAFMPSGIMTKFIIRNGRKFSTSEGSKFWKYGIFIKDDGLEVLVHEDRHKKTLTIKIYGGEYATVTRYTSWIREEIEDIHRRLNLGGVEMGIPCTCDECQAKNDPHIFKFDKLLRRLKKGIPHDECDISYEKIDIRSLLEVQKIYPESAERSSGRRMSKNDSMHDKKLTVFFSYSRKDMAYRDEIDSHFASLRRNDHIEAWYDQEILPGERWDTVIMDKLRAADIVLLLVSADFLNSDYCNKEMQIALDREEKGLTTVVPVIVRPCLWQDFPFAKLNALPTSGVAVEDRSWRTKDDAYLDITKGLKRIVGKLVGS